MINPHLQKEKKIRHKYIWEIYAFKDKSSVDANMLVVNSEISLLKMCYVTFKLGTSTENSIPDV